MAVASLEKTKLINGLQKTRDEAVVQNMKLVRKMADRYEYKAKRVGLDFNDLVSLGAMGLMKAFDDFDDSLGFRFSTYAVPKIKGEITRGISKSHIGAHYSVNIRRDADMIQSRELEDCSIEEISKTLDMNTKRVKHALEYITQGMPVSFDMTLPGKDDQELSTFGDLFGKNEDFSSVWVNEFIRLLKEKERQIVYLLLENRTATEIGVSYGTTYQAVSYHVEQIRNKWVLYQYGLPADKKKKEIKKLVSESELKTIMAGTRQLIARKQIASRKDTL